MRFLTAFVFKLRQLVQDNGPQVLALAEACLTPEISDEEIELPGFNVLRSDSNSRGGGVLLYFTHELKLVHVSSPLPTMIPVNFSWAIGY